MQPYKVCPANLTAVKKIGLLFLHIQQLEMLEVDL